MKGLVLTVALLTCACSRSPDPGNSKVEQAVPNAARSDDGALDGDIRAEFLRLTGDDPWANWPADLAEDPNDRGRYCYRVSDGMRETAIDMLQVQPAIEIDPVQYKRLVGAVRPPGGGTAYLLRGFSSKDSFSRLKWSGNAVVVHSDPTGRLVDVRRHPCVAILNRRPSAVFTVAMYDL